CCCCSWWCSPCGWAVTSRPSLPHPEPMRPTARPADGPGQPRKDAMNSADTDLKALLDERLAALEPAQMELVDESHLHAGHAGGTRRRSARRLAPLTDPDRPGKTP